MKQFPSVRLYLTMRVRIIKLVTIFGVSLRIKSCYLTLLARNLKGTKTICCWFS